jgi:hypothetical protein
VRGACLCRAQLAPHFEERPNAGGELEPMKLVIRCGLERAKEPGMGRWTFAVIVTVAAMLYFLSHTTAWGR